MEQLYMNKLCGDYKNVLKEFYANFNTIKELKSAEIIENYFY